MTVTLIAHTVLTSEALDVIDRDSWETSDSDHLAEIAGRECYQSWSRPNPATAANADYLSNVIRQNHTSVLAHASFTFRLTDVSRSLTHELIRHRFLAVSELSQRYVNMEDSYIVTPPLLRDRMGDPMSGVHDEEGEEVSIGSVVKGAECDAHFAYERLVVTLIENGATRKQAREAARCVLPGGTNTAMIVSGNVRAWRDFIQQRNSDGADAEIREVAASILTVLREYAPNSVSDP